MGRNDEGELCGLLHLKGLVKEMIRFAAGGVHVFERVNGSCLIRLVAGWSAYQSSGEGDGSDRFESHKSTATPFSD